MVFSLAADSRFGDRDPRHQMPRSVSKALATSWCKHPSMDPNRTPPVPTKRKSIVDLLQPIVVCRAS